MPSSVGIVRPGRSYPRGWRIASLVRRGLSPMLAALHAGVTVRRVSVNGDLSVATVHYSMLAGDAEDARERLSRDAARLRRRLAGELNMRATPKLVFVPDDEGMAADDMRSFLDSIVPNSAAEK